MRRILRKLLLALSLLTVALTARAQFYLNGDDPGCLRWYSIETPHYELIFPEGADSLARLYGRALEQYRLPIGRSLGGMTPGTGQRWKMPVVLHTHNPYSNGSVGWAPRRMDLFTHPEAYEADPIPWYLQLSAHEPRHQAQLQFGQRGFFSWITGEMWAPVYWQVYMEMAFGEGDAVVGETGLASGTRARTADFLNYYRVALDNGQRRSWDRWRYGSFKHYTPNHYALGYVTLGGARSLWDAPLLMRESLDLAREKPWFIAPYNTQKVISNHAGKPFKQAFNDILDHFQAAWQENDAARGPFLPLEAVTPREDYALEYSSPQWTPKGIVAVREGYLYPKELVLISGGRIQHLHAMQSETSALAHAPGEGRIYWSETQFHPRWGLGGSSVIRFYDIWSGCLRQLTSGTRYHNPRPSADGKTLAVVEYPVEGGAFLVVLDAETGRVLRRKSFPEGVQGTEAVFLGGDLYALGISAGGFGLYRLSPEGSWGCVLEPSAQKMRDLEAESRLAWVSDRSGVNERYSFDPSSGELLQITSTHYGATNFAEGEDGQLYCVSQTLRGRSIFRIPQTLLQPRKVNHTDLAAHPIEDKLTAQELSLGPAPDPEEAVPMGAPKRYRKLAHPLRLHSWLPAYVNYDAVKSGSMDFSYETASLGLSGYFQNTLGTFSGMLGYAVHPDPDRDGAWRSALHLKMTYSGLFPVFEASLDIGDQSSRMCVPLHLRVQGREGYALTSVLQATPQIQGSLRTYIPLSFSRSGILYGVTPQLSYSFNNDIFALQPIDYAIPLSVSGLPTTYRQAGPIPHLSGPATQLVGASVRGYAMARRAKSQTYPRWGIGAEVGIGLRPGLEPYYTPNLYGYAYGYLPGLTRSQGLRWTLKGQTKTAASWRIGDLYTGVAPRGFNSATTMLIGQNFQWQWRATADYAIPIYVGEISIPAVAYIKNFLLTPHADYTRLPHGYDLWSAGADLTASLARLFVLPFDASLGVSFSYLGGLLYPYTGVTKPYSVSLVLGVDF